MKKEDMMKLLCEEKTGLKTGSNKYRLVFLLFLFQEIIFPQIPFKGFCKINSLDVEPGFTRIISLNFDNNEYSDLLVYNPLSKNAELYSGTSGTTFQLKRKFELPLEISNLQNILIQNNKTEHFAFTSRKERTFGTLTFLEDGNVAITNQIKFEYYPENISISYNQNFGEHEFLISGNSFYGVSLINTKSNQLFEKKITSKTLFMDAKFIDLNSDGYDDFVAVNSIKNKIHFFFRNSKNDFEDLRQISFTSEITSLQIFDFNYDGFTDILVSSNDGITLYFGDAAAAYKNSVFIKTIYSADKFVYGDYNRDGFFDLNYINKQNGIVSTIFAKNFTTFYPELIHFKNEGLSDLITFYSKFVNGVACLSGDGKINLISKVSSFSEEQTLALALKPSLLNVFDYLNNGVIDFAFVNDENNSLNFILRDASGLPENIFTIELYEQHKNLKAAQISKEKKCFYLFSDDKQSVEALEVDLSKFSFKRSIYYANGFLQDVIIKPDERNELEIFLLYSDKGKLGLQVQTKTDDNYISKYYDNLEKNWSDAFIISEVSRTIGYLQKTKNNLIYKTVKADDKNYKIMFNVNLNFNNSLNFTNDCVSANYSQNKFIGTFSDSRKLGLFINDKVYYNSQFTGNQGFRITTKNHLFFGKNKSVFISNDLDKTVYEIKIDNKLNQFNAREILKNQNINNFILEKLEPRTNNLIFTNTQNGFIEIRQLH